MNKRSAMSGFADQVAQPLGEGIGQGILIQVDDARKRKEQQRLQKEAEDRILKRDKEELSQGRKVSKVVMDEKGNVNKTYEDKDLTKKDEIKQQREERLAKQYELSNASRIRQEFIKRPEVEDFTTVSTNVAAMESLLNDALTKKDKTSYLAVDQGLITMFNKLTDPQSVVRESEYARTPQNLPVVNAIVGAIGKLQEGGAGLTDEDRKALVEGAKIIQAERGKQYNQTLQEYTDLANQYGLDVNMVTRGRKPFETGEQQPQQPTTIPAVGQTFNGQKVIGVKRIQ